MKIHFLTSEKPEAQAAYKSLTALYGSVPVDAADVIAPIGGDGFMLETLKQFMNSNIPVYGINRGTVGFLMNAMAEKFLPERINVAELVQIHPLEMQAVDDAGKYHQGVAVNEVSLLRESRQTARIDVTVNGRKRIEALVCDGIMVATPAGSTAYNLSAHGPILPISSRLLALTPISAFRPRRWRGALLPHDAVVEFDIHDHEFRSVSAVADNIEVRNIRQVKICERADLTMRILYDRGQSLEERIIQEQFAH